MNGVGGEKGGVGLHISNDIKYKLRHDLCIVNSNFESYFVETKNNNMKNSFIGVMYNRAHTVIDNFINDDDPILQTISNEKKKDCYIMGTITKTLKR